jgi:hypothetical protein
LLQRRAGNLSAPHDREVDHMPGKPQDHHDSQATAAGSAEEPPSAPPTTADTDASAEQAPDAVQSAAPEEDLRQHAEMLARLVADYRGCGLLVLRGRRADPQGSGVDEPVTLQPEESDIVNGIKHIRTRSRKVPNQIVKAAEDIAEYIPVHHLYAPLAIMDDALPAGQPGREADVVGVLGLVVHFEDVTDPGAATARAAAQAVRLSVIYALIDGSEVVRPEHLEAAREVWRYCSDAVRHVLGHAPDAMEDKLLEVIVSAGDKGLSGTQLRDLFGRHGSTADRTAALGRLQRAGLVAKVLEKGQGRPKTIWVATK